MIGDRLSVYQGFNLSMEAALEQEFQMGMEVISQEGLQTGATRNLQGIGKHGYF